MDLNKGLIIGIDIQKNNIQTSYFDLQTGFPEMVRFASDKTYIDTPPYISALFDDTAMYQTKDVVNATAFIGEIIKLAQKQSKNPAIEKVCVTTTKFEKTFLDIIRRIMNKLLITDSKLRFISHEECYAYYAYSQKPELYVRGVMLLDYDRNGLHTHLMKNIKKNGSDIIFESSEDFVQEDILAAASKEKTLSQVEDLIISDIRQANQVGSISSYYLTGEGFDVDDFPEKLTHLLCAGHRAFAGQNLYVKGACYCAYSDSVEDILADKVLACNNRITTGIEMDILDRNQVRRFRFVKPGINWYGANRHVDFILDDVRSLKLIMKPCDGSGDYEEMVDISRIPYREAKMTRIRMDISFKNDHEFVITVSDKGFGEFVKSSDVVIRKEFTLH